MIIRRLIIKNFQAHEHLDIELGEFSCITGQSSSGKTAIFRALNWAFYGEFDKTYPRDSELDTSIAIQLDNGTIIKRSRKGDKNRAAIKLPGQEPMAFEDFGAIIPGLYELANVRPIQAGTREVNLTFSNQEDPVFMIGSSWSGPSRAAWLGRLYGAHIVTAMLRLMSADKKEQEAARKRYEAEAEALVARLDVYGDTKAQAAAIAEARAAVDRMAALEACQTEAVAIAERTRILRRSEALLAADLAGLKEDAIRLQALYTALQDHARALQDAKAASARSGLLEANLGALKADCERLGRLRQAAGELVAIAGLGSKGARLRVIDDLDLEGLKTDTMRLDRLRGLRHNAILDAKAQAETAEILAGCLKELGDLKGELKDDVLADGSCPVCRSNVGNLNPDTLHCNLKMVMGV